MLVNNFSSQSKLALCYYGDLLVNTSTLKFFIVNSPKTKFSDEQVILNEFTGKHFSRNEAEILLRKIMNHKWNMSEMLRRDVGLKVAAIDFMENFYQPNEISKGKSLINKNSMKTLITKFARFYFEEKGKAIFA
jgi:hypothetical protein